VIHGRDNVLEEILRFVYATRKKIDGCVDRTRPVLAMEIEPFKKSFVDAKTRDVKLRYLTEITKDNIEYCKDLIEIVHEFRHLEGIKGNFYIGDTEYIAPATFHEKGKPASQMIYSNLKEIVELQQYIFDTLWNKAIPAEQKIREIEEGIEPEFYEVISDKNKAARIITDMTKSIDKEALLLFPVDKALNRIDKLGVIDSLIGASTKKNKGASIRIICPHSHLNLEIVKRINTNAPNIRIRDGPPSTHSMFIVDNSKLFSADVRNPNADEFREAIGITVYSNSVRNISLFKSFFELLWNERIIIERLHETERLQKEFINIAAHELRTPVTPILIMATALKSELEDYNIKQDNSGKEVAYVKIRKKDFSIIARSALRLKQLTDHILDVARIESQTLRINREQFNLKEVIHEVVQEFIKNQQVESEEGWKKDVKIHYPHIDNGDTIVEADKVRIMQVIFNLLSNAFKFTEEGDIFISTEKGDGFVTVNIRDSGIGIDPEIAPRLFTKFATKSFHGTGLGLFISKSIMEAHGESIWGKNNENEKGATFSFRLPFLDE
jgi:two-component system sensor histidine kinase VicK